MFADLCLPFLLLLAGLVFSRLLCRNFTFHLRVICAVIDSLFCISCNQITSFLILVLKVIIWKTCGWSASLFFEKLFVRHTNKNWNISQRLIVKTFLKAFAFKDMDRRITGLIYLSNDSFKVERRSSLTKISKKSFHRVKKCWKCYVVTRLPNVKYFLMMRGD